MALAALAFSLLSARSASSQETNAAAESSTAAVDVSSLDLMIAVAPSPPVVGEEVMLISRLTGPADQVAAVNSSWNFEWTRTPTDSGWEKQSTLRVLTKGTRSLVEFPSAGTHRIELAVCREDRSLPCLTASVDVTVDDVGNRPGTIELDVPSPTRIEEGLTATVTSPDVEILGTYFELRGTRSWPISTSPPGNAATVNFSSTEPGRYTVVAAACYLAPNLVCQTAEQQVRVELSACLGSDAPLTAPADVALKRFNRTRLRWTDTNNAETGYRIRAGASLSTLAPFAEVPCDAEGIPLPNEGRPACFEVTPLGRNADGPPATTCERSTRADDTSPSQLRYWVNAIDAWANDTPDSDILEVGFIGGALNQQYRQGFTVTARTHDGVCRESNAVFVNSEDDAYELRRNAPDVSMRRRVYSARLLGIPAADISSIYIDERRGCSAVNKVLDFKAPDDDSATVGGSSKPDILIAPFPPVVGETVMFALRDSDDRDASTRNAWTIEDDEGSRIPEHNLWDRTRRITTTKLKRAGTHTVAVTQCNDRRDNCRVVAERTFTVTTANQRPTVDLALEVSPTRAFRDEPITVAVEAADGADIGESIIRLDPHLQDSGVTSSTTFVTTPETAGPTTIVAAVCLAGAEPTCELVNTDIDVERRAVGTAATPAPVTDLAIDIGVPARGRRLRWTDTNELESGYRVSSGPSLDALALLGDYPSDTSGVHSTDETHTCFEVRAIYGDALGPAANHCAPATRPEPPPNMILTDAKPVVGEPVTFHVNGLRDVFSYWGAGQTALPEWRFGDTPANGSPEWTTDTTHTFETPGTYEVSVRDADGESVTQLITVSPTRTPDNTDLQAPSNVEHFAQIGVVTFSDTNEGEDGYVVQDDYGSWLVHTGPNATMAETSVGYSEYQGYPYCIEVRAFKDAVLGPARSSCNFSPGAERWFDPTNVAVSPGSQAGELRVRYSTYVSNNMPFHHEIAAIDLDVGFEDYWIMKPRCHLITGPRGFDYEVGTPGIDLVRTHTVTIDGLTAGNSYAVGFAHQSDLNGATHNQTWRAEAACRPHPSSPEVVAP